MWGVFLCLLGYSAALKRVVGEDALANGTCSEEPENSSLAQFAGMDECTDKYEGDIFDAAAMAEMLLAEECQMFIVDTEEGDEEEIGFSLGQDMFVYHVLRFFQGKQVSYDGLGQVLAVLRETKETADADVVRNAIKLVQRLQEILAFDKCEARFKKESMAGGFNPKEVAKSLASAECRAFHAENGELQQRLLGILKTIGSYPEWKQVQQKAEELLAKYSKAKNVAAYEWAVAYAQQAKRYWRDEAPKVGHSKSAAKKSQDDAESLPSSPELASPVAELPANAGSTRGCEEDVDCGALKAARKVEQAAAEKFKKCCEQDVVPDLRRALSFDRSKKRAAEMKKRQEREQQEELGKPTRLASVPAHGGHNIAEELYDRMIDINPDLTEQDSERTDSERMDRSTSGIGRSISGVGRSVSRLAKTDRKPPPPPPEPSTPSARIERSSSGMMGRLRSNSFGPKKDRTNLPGMIPLWLEPSTSTQPPPESPGASKSRSVVHAARSVFKRGRAQSFDRARNRAAKQAPDASVVVDELPPLPTTGFDTADAETGQAISLEALEKGLEEGFWDDDDE